MANHPVLLRLLLLIAIPVSAQDGLQAIWTHLGPHRPEEAPEGGSRLQLRLENHGRRPLPSTGWSIFLSSAHVLHTDGESKVVVENLGGDFHRLRPTASFQVLAPGKAETLTLWTPSTMGNISAAPGGTYFVEDRNPARCFPVQSTVVRPFPPSGPDGPASGERAAADRFERNADIADLALPDLPPVFPTPAFLLKGTGTLHFNAIPSITAAPGLESDSRQLKSYLRPWFKDLTSRPGVGIRLEVGDIDGLSGEEAYLLVIDPQQGIRIRGRSAAGVFHGIQTLRGLLPLTPGASGVSLPVLTVKDAPRFGYRGLHLDVARNFQPKASVLRVLELMARYKLNVFHFHLTDDEGWRLEIRGLPELTTLGARRGHTLTSESFLPPAYGSGPLPGRPFGSGFFTREDYKQILRQAKRLHIEVIPELEMPGHARAAIKAMEARYQASRGTDLLEAERYRLVDPDDASVYISAQNYRDNVMNPALPSTYAFIDKVVTELVALHREAGTPLKHLHMGGDEVPAGVWERSPRVQALLKTKGWSSVDDCWPLFYGQVDDLLRAQGVPLSGWEEIALKKLQSGGRTSQHANPEFAQRGWRTYVWNNVPGWGNEDLAYQLANAGYQVVLCPVTNLYFDLAANPEPGERGLRWGGFLDVDKPFDFIPMDYYRSTREDHLGRPLNPKVFEGKARLTPTGRDHILGLQGCLWSETLTEDGKLEYMLIPKLLGLAERAWAPNPAWATEADPAEVVRLHREDWHRFLNILGKRELPRLAREHPAVRFRMPAPGLLVAHGRVWCNFQFPGMTLRYTLDGTEPTGHSPILAGNLPAEGTVKVAAFDAGGRKGPAAAVTCGGGQKNR